MNQEHFFASGSSRPFWKIFKHLQMSKVILWISEQIQISAKNKIVLIAKLANLKLSEIKSLPDQVVVISLDLFQIPRKMLIHLLLPL